MILKTAKINFQQKKDIEFLICLVCCSEILNPSREISTHLVYRCRKLEALWSVGAGVRVVGWTTMEPWPLLLTRDTHPAAVQTPKILATPQTAVQILRIFATPQVAVQTPMILATPPAVV